MITLFRIRGIPIRLDAGWLLVFAFITWSLASGYFPYVAPDLPRVAYWATGIAATLLLFTSVLLHELAHALVARERGVGVTAITLHVFGGVSELENDAPDARAEFAIAVVGPATSLLLAGLIFLVGRLVTGPPWLDSLVGYLAAVNLAVGVFNLAPGFPLDGGRIVRAVLWWWRGREEWATRIAARAGVLFALLLVALGVVRLLAGDPLGGVWLAMLGLFLFHAARASEESARIRHRLVPLTAEAVMTPAPPAVSASTPLTSIPTAELRARHVGALLVVDDTGLVGFLRLSDVERGRRGWRRRAGTVREAMVPVAADTAVSRRDSAWLAFTRLARNRLGRVAVVDDGRVLGLVSMRDVRQVLAADGAGDAVERAA
jgi:Zn-dependent protease